MLKLNNQFYLQEDVLQVAKDLLGKVLVTKTDGEITSGRIVETEAYAGIIDKASHACVPQIPCAASLPFAAMPGPRHR